MRLHTRHTGPPAPARRAIGLAALAWLLAAAAAPPAVELAYPTGDGDVVYRFTPRTGTLNDLEVVFGETTFRPSEFGGITSFLLAGRRLDPWSGEHQVTLLEESATGGGYRATFRWSLEGDSFDFEVRLRLAGPTLVMDFEADPGRVLQFDLDRSQDTPDAKIVELPYGHNVLLANGLFTSALLDPRRSNASQIFPTRIHVSPTSAAFGDLALYRPPTGGTVGPLRETVLLTVSPQIEDTFYRPPNPVSPYRRRLADTVVVDLWGRGSFAEGLADLEFLASKGVRDALVVLHVWQRDGYDNALPSTVPASEAMGGEAGLTAISDFCREQGHRFALHTNYVDFYPNSDLWEPADLALDPEGQPIETWFNRQTGVQSFLMKPSRSLAYARLHEPEIARRYGTSASFLDVHSAVLPSMRVDYDAAVAGAARQLTTFQRYRELMTYARGVHAGPLAGEGKGFSTAVWAGLVDAMEADPRSFHQDLERRSGSEVPTLVDYKLRVLHRLFVPHGAGYLVRFYRGRASYPKPLLDRYLATELAFGNAGFFDQNHLRPPQRNQVERKYRFLRAMQRHYVGGRATEILYLVGGEWLPLSDALRAVLPGVPTARIDAVLRERLGILQVRYLPDFTLVVNRSETRSAEVLRSDTSFVLRPNDFLALAADRPVAYAAEVDGVRKELACDSCAAQADVPAPVRPRF